MKASQFVNQVKKKHSAKITVTNGKLRVQNLKKLPRFLQIAIVGHRPQLQRYLVDGVDEELSVQQNGQLLEEMGCFRILVSETFEGNHLTQHFAWTHPDSDQVLDELLVGLLDPQEAVANTKARDLRSRMAEWAHAHPPIGRLFGR